MSITKYKPLKLEFKEVSNNSHKDSIDHYRPHSAVKWHVSFCSRGGVVCLWREGGLPLEGILPLEEGRSALGGGGGGGVCLWREGGLPLEWGSAFGGWESAFGVGSAFEGRGVLHGGADPLPHQPSVGTHPTGMHSCLAGEKKIKALTA